MQKIEIVRGTTNTFQIEVRDANGDLLAAGKDEKVIFGVKRNAEDDNLIIAKAATMTDTGIFTVTLSPADTEGLKFGRYFYDVGLQSGEQYYNIIEPMPFIIQANITKRGCA